MCTPQAKPDPRLAGFVAPKRNIVNEFKPQVTRYTDMEDANSYYAREVKERVAWRKVAENKNKDIKEFYSGFSRKRGEAGMTAKESSASFNKRKKAELEAFNASEAGMANETEAAYKERLKAAQQAYISSRPATTTPATPAISAATGAPSVAKADRMANKLKQRTAQRVSRASSGRAMLRIGR